MNHRLKSLTDAGVSIWLDDLSRSSITNGDLNRKIAELSVTGVTTKPTTLAAALSKGDDYTLQLRDLKEPIDVDHAIKLLCTTDVRNACDQLAESYATSGGYDGRVSIEVTPTLAHDTGGTIAYAEELHHLVGRENVMIKIPATESGLLAIRACIAAGISVNATLIFSEQRYVRVMDAYLSGLEEAAATGYDLSRIHSVASFSISQVDTEIDRQLVSAGRDELTNKAAIANAVVAYDAFEHVFGSSRFARLAARGANEQRPLWASTEVKDPKLPDTLYVTSLIAHGVINTMPEKTLCAFADHGELGPSIVGQVAGARSVLEDVAYAGVDLADTFQRLEDEGLEKFIDSWNELIVSLEVLISRAQ